MLTVFITISIINKFKLLILQVIIIIFILSYHYKILWLFYLIVITFISGLLVLFAYTITTIKKEHKFRVGYKTFLILITINFIVVLPIISTTIDIYINNIWEFNRIRFILRGKNITLVIKSVLLLRLILFNSRLITKKISLNLRNYKTVSK